VAKFDIDPVDDCVDKRNGDKVMKITLIETTAAAERVYSNKQFIF